mgnify:FL=1
MYATTGNCYIAGVGNVYCRLDSFSTFFLTVYHECIFVGINEKRFSTIVGVSVPVVYFKSRPEIDTGGDV